MIRWLPILPLIIPLCGAVLLFMAKKNMRAVTSGAWMITGIGTLVSVLLICRVNQNGPVAVAMGSWPAPFGIVFAADLLSAAMVLISWIIAMGVVIYAAADLESSPAYSRYHLLIQLLLAGVNGAFLTADLFNLYVWFEVMLIASFSLMVLDAGEQQIHGSIRYVFLNLISTMTFLLAIGLIYGATGMLNLAGLHLKSASLSPGLATLLTGLFLFSFSVKSALFPVFAWLPASYHTLPASVAALFAALLTKVGIYAMMRIFTLVLPFEGSIWQTLLIVVSGLTMLTGVLGAASQYTIKRILSFHIISQVGYIIIGLALYTRLALAGSILYLIHHIIVKANLFLIGGFLNHRFGSDHLSKTGGVYKSFPFLALLFMIPAFSLAGFPPLSGFWSKFAVIRAGIETGHYLLAGTALFVGILTIYSMLKIWNQAFWTPAPETAPSQPFPNQKRTVPYLIPIGVFALMTIIIGLAAEPFFNFADRAAMQLLDPVLYIKAVLGGAS
ncbi:proton-conducting transporter membrane subunit [Desulfospira joergensenii]|uniref:proton-conducting transporter transmembrane domain-containing protein n=1 Tax=Desulfospira joergensenii TaxID=53329 RepID=UPI0003B6EFA3|nr:proton-conducting transporter membrane subunit [Desulfospira joergensenii]